MVYSGKPSNRNTGITKWRRPHENPGISPSAQTYEEFEAVITKRLCELGPCILPGGRGQPQIIIAPKYTKLKTIKGEFSVIRTGSIPDYSAWAERLIKDNPGKFNSNISVYTRSINAISHRAKYETIGMDIVYFISAEDMPYVKIGTTKDLSGRLDGIQTSIPYDLSVLFTIDGGTNVERKTHAAFEEYRKRGEWFKVEGKLKDYIEYMMDVSNGYMEPWEYVEGVRV